MTPRSIEALIRSGRLQPVPADPWTARAKVREAERHLASAGSIAESDPHGAYQLLYDAARKAVDAHMLANGLRVRTSRPGAHEWSVRYAEVMLSSASEHVAHLDRMRRTRNRAEYGVWEITPQMVAADLAHARQIVSAIADELGAASAE